MEVGDSSDASKSGTGSSSSLIESSNLVPSTSSLSSVSMVLPRIAEEKDSPKDDHTADASAQEELRPPNTSTGAMPKFDTGSKSASVPGCDKSGKSTQSSSSQPLSDGQASK